MKKKMFKSNDTKIISIDDKINQYIYMWLCNEKGKGNVFNHLKMFLSILNKIGIEGSLSFTDFKEGRFKIRSNNIQYEIELKFAESFKRKSEIIVIKDNISNSYVYSGYDDKCELCCTVKNYHNIQIKSNYSEDFTNYYLSSRQFEIDLCIYEPIADEIKELAKKRNLIENQLIYIKDFTRIESIISLISSVYTKNIIKCCEKISLEIKKLEFQLNCDEKKKILLSKIVISHGKLAYAFEKDNQYSVSVDLLKGRLEYCDEECKITFNNSSDQAIIEFNRDADENDKIAVKDFARKKVDYLIAKDSNIIANTFK